MGDGHVAMFAAVDTEAMSAMAGAPPPETVDAPFFAHIDERADSYVARLAELVGIQGVSCEPDRRGDVEATVKWVKDWCERLGAKTQLQRLGMQTLADGKEIPLPPVLQAAWGDPVAEPHKPTLLVYGHLDVQPASRSDGWDSECGDEAHTHANCPARPFPLYCTLSKAWQPGMTTPI